MIQGFVKIVKSIDGKITEIIEKENLVVANFYTLVLGFNAGGITANIFISSNTDAPNFDIGDSLLPDMVYGYIPTGVTSPTYIDSVTPHFAQYQVQFAPPTTSRTFQTVGLIGGNSKIIAYLALDTPCTQATNEFLDVFYRLQFTNTSNVLIDDAIDTFGRAITVGTPSFDTTSTAYYFGSCDPDYLNLYKKPYAPIANLIDGFPSQSGTSNNWASGELIESHFKYKQLSSYTELQQVGKIVNQILYGRNPTEQYAYYLDKTNNPTKIQSFFTHSESADKPFFDSLSLAANEENIISLAGTWTGNYPELYKISMTASGATGTATYKFSVRNWLGFYGNTYIDETQHCPYLNPNVSSVSNLHGWKDEERIDILRYSDTQIVQYDLTGITLLDVISGVYKTWDTTTTPSLTVTQLRQVAVDITNKKIYCACRATGLWIIDVITNVITHPITSPCYGVDVGRGNVGFAITPSGIVKSSDYGTTLSIDITLLSSCQFLKADPLNVNDNLAVVIFDGSNYQIKWYIASTETTIDGTTIGARPFPGSLEVSDIDGVWCYGDGFLTFGTTDYLYSNTRFSSKTLNHTVYGSDTYYKIDFYKSFVIGTDGLYNSSGSVEVTYLQATEAAYSLHLKDGIILYGSRLKQLFTDNAYCWSNYGWNGSAWIKDNSGSKLTHTDVQPLLNGITIAFEDAASLPHWVNTDYYTFAVANGLVKDNATTLYVDFSWYSAPALFHQPYSVAIPSGLEITLPCASDFSFITLEVDSPEVHIFKINDILVTLVRNDGTSPAPNEVTIFADGRVQFNMADIGKSFTASYAYIKV